MITATDGTAFTGTVTVYVTGDGGTQGIGTVGSGVCTSEGFGLHTYVPSQAETNYDHVAFTFTGTGAVPATLQVYTTFPQTGDGFASLTTLLARLGAFTGSGINTVLGFLQAIMRNDASLTPSDVGGTFDNTEESLEALEDNQPFIIV